MLVRLKRNWFAPNGVHYRPQDGLSSVPDSYKDQLPKGAEVMSFDEPDIDKGKPKLPGFGAKPAHEQVLDQLPGGAPTHLITGNAGEGQNAEPDSKVEDSKAKMPLAIDKAEMKDKKIKDAKLDI